MIQEGKKREREDRERRTGEISTTNRAHGKADKLSLLIILLIVFHSIHLYYHCTFSTSFSSFQSLQLIPFFLRSQGPPQHRIIFIFIFSPTQLAPPALYRLVQLLYQKKLEWPALPSHPDCSPHPPPTTNPITQKK